MKITDLEFKPHPVGLGGTQAKPSFANGYGASVITGSCWACCLPGGYFYTTITEPYEIAVIGPNGKLDYTTPVTDDVCGYLTEDAANAVLAQIEALERP